MLKQFVAVIKSIGFFKRALLLFSVLIANFIVATSSFSQTTTCNTATVLTAVNASSCTPGTTFNISGTGTGPAMTSCNTNGTAANNWGQFVANGTIATISYNPANGTDAMIYAYSGSCPSGLTEISCIDVAGNGGQEDLVLTSLTPGATYYVRIVRYGSTSNMNGSICIASPYSISTGTVSGSPFCAGNSVSVPFTSYGTYSSNTYTAQLSNATGSFSNPVSIGTLVSNSNSGTISAIIPAGTGTGSGYRIRVISSGPAVTGSDNGTNLTIVAATVTITSAAGTNVQTVCNGTAITNITYSVGGTATGAGIIGLPTGVTGSFSAGVFTISGTPTASGTFNYTVTTTGGSCTAATATGTITVNVLGTISLTSAAGTNVQTRCNGAAITNITYSVGGTATGAGVSGLPTGVTGNFSAGVFTISGTPTANGTFNYIATTTGGSCPVTATGTITVNGLPTISLTSAAGTNAQTVCNGTAITSITYLIGGTATGAGIIGLPTGVTGSFSAGVFTISGTPIANGTFNYTVTTTGGSCTAATATGTITVNVLGTITLTSAAGTNVQTRCNGAAITNITYSVGGTATGAGVSGLPTGVTGSFSAGVFTISGTPTANGTFNYIVTTTGGSCPATATGSITVNAATVTLTSAAGTNAQNVCNGTAITIITYSVGGSATGAVVSGLPTGVTGNFSAGVFTISGTPTANGTFNYTVTTTGGSCIAATSTGTITVNGLGTISLTSAVGTNVQTVCNGTALTNITYSVGGTATGAGVSGLPTGVTGSFSASVFTISGTPTANGTFNYIVTTTGGSCPVTATGTITVNAATVTLTSAAGTNAQTVCNGTAITNVTYLVGGTATGAGIIGLPTGVTGSFSAGVFTISGTPTASGTFNYTVTTTGGSCTAATATGTITVNVLGTILLTSAAGTNVQTRCNGVAITNITYSVGGTATGAGVSGLPTGVTGNFSASVFTISGTPTANGTFNYIVTTTGGSCPVTATGTITVNAATVTLTSAAGTNAQTVCNGTAITSITYSVGGIATGAGVSGLPTGLTGSFSAGVFTISGTPTASGIFNYTITTTGGSCTAVTATGTININALPTVTISANYCIGGGVVRLTCSAQTSYLWSTGATSQFIDVITAGNYSVTGTNAAGCSAIANINVAVELVTNGNFSSGNSGFTTLYNYNVNLYPEGNYYVGTNANTYHPGFYCNSDHTTGSGNFMIVNGSPVSQNIWQQTVTVLPNRIYYFSAWATSMNAVAPYAQLQFSVNSVQVGTVATLPAGASSTAGPFTWYQFYGTWNSGSNTTAVINVIDLQTALGGNDFGLDDISFSTLSPVSMTLAPTTNSPVCIGNALNISANLTGGTSPVTYSWTGPSSYTSSTQNPVISSAIASNAGIYSLTVTDGYGCVASANTSSVIVNGLPTITLSSAAGTNTQTLCNSSAITNITYTAGGTATGAGISGLPAGITGAYSGGVFTISGIPTANGTFNYTVTTTGGSCTAATATGTITVNGLATITRTSAVATTAQTVCNGTAINNITYSVSGTGTGAGVSGLPTGVTGAFSAGVFTINGTPAANGTFNYTVTTTGGSCSVTATGTITVNAALVTLSSAAGTNTQTLCNGIPITNITYSVGGTATGAGVSGLPTGVTGTFNASVFTISGTPTANGTFNYTVTTTGGSCTASIGTGTIIVNALPIDITPIAAASIVCSGNSTNIQIPASQSGVIYQLRNNAGNANIGSTAAGTGGTINLPTGSLSATTTFNVLASNSVSGCAVQMVNTVIVNVNPTGQWVGGTSGDWNTASNWCGGIPASSSNVFIPAGSTVNIQSANAVANSVTITATGSLVMTGANNLNITAGGSFNNSGIFTTTSSTGSVAFLGNGTISGTTTFKNIDSYGALNFGAASTIAGIFSIQTGGSVTGNSPTYTCPSSSLLYKPGSVYTRGLEWTSASSGAGYPANVLVQNNTTINFPVAGNGYVCYDVQIDAGSSLQQDYSGGSASLSVGRNITINGTLKLGGSTSGDISLGGNWTRNAGGIFTHNDRKVTFDGPANFSGNGISMSTITAPASAAKDNEGGFGGENFAHLWINKTNATDSVVLLSNITVNRELGFTKGTFSLRNSDVTIVSNSTRTADIAPVTTIANISIRYGGTGKFVVQRFIQNPTATRSWRLLTAPLQSATAPSINEAFMEGVVNPNKNLPNGSAGIYNPWPGYGTHITGPGGLYSAANGFDQGTTSASILYAGSGVLSWLSPTSTISTKVTDQQGWMLFVRGDRSFIIGNQYMPSANTILEPKGRINIGNISVPVTTGRQVIGNPYPSAISLLNVDVAGTLAKNRSYYMWDPKMFTSYIQPGKWVTFTGLGTSFVQTSSQSAYTSDGKIESGQAFVIDAGSIGNITFHESDKLALISSLVGIANATGARPQANPVFPIFRSDIYAKADSAYRLTDGVLNVFNSSFNNAANSEDAKKIISFNTKESLSILRDSVKIAIEKRSDIQDTDTIFFAMSKFNELLYRFRFEANDFAPGYEAFLEDKFTSNRLQLSTAGVSEIDFAISANPLSKAEDRFRVVFKSPYQAVLPVTFTSVRAWQQNNKIAVQWQVANEINIKEYEVEKSVDGTRFTKANTTLSQGIFTGNFIYNWLDENAAGGDNFYRIKSNSINEKSGYSKVVKVRVTNSNGGIDVYPNPVSDGTIRLRFNNMEKGNYFVRLMNSTGQTMTSTTFSNAGAFQMKEIQLAKGVAKGIYEIEVVNPGNEKYFVKVIVE